MKKPGRMGKKNRKDERLKQIVRTASGLFYKYGYAQTTTRQIAEACGISQSNLYYYIKSKDDFFNLFVDMTTELSKEYDREISKQLPHISFAEALKMKIKEALVLQNTIQDMMLFWYRESKTMSREHLGQLIQLEWEAKELLRKIIEAGCKSGEFNVKDPQLAAYFIVMLEHMWSLKRWHLRKHFTLEEYTRRCQDAAMGIVRAVGKGTRPHTGTANRTKLNK